MINPIPDLILAGIRIKCASMVHVVFLTSIDKSKVGRFRKEMQEKTGKPISGEIVAGE